MVEFVLVQRYCCAEEAKADSAFHVENHHDDAVGDEYVKRYEGGHFCRRGNKGSRSLRSQLLRATWNLDCRCETRDRGAARGETHLRGQPSIVYRTGQKLGP